MIKDLLFLDAATASVDVLKEKYIIQPVDMVQDGAEYNDVSLSLFDETVHVVIADRTSTDNWMLSAATDNNDAPPAVDKFLNKIMKGADLTEYNKNPYDFTPYHAEIFLPIVFPSLQTKRKTGEAVQVQMEGKIKKLKEYAYTCAKLAYMVYFGIDAQRLHDSDLQINQARYRAVVRASNYGMWGKWYNDYNGWHRGIDMNYKKDGVSNCIVRAIIGGEIVDQAGYYLSIYNSDIGVTVTYMHLRINSSIENRTITCVVTGQQLGIQSAEGADAVHTHVEFNHGRVINNDQRAFARPWSDQQGEIKDIPASKIKPGLIREAVVSTKPSENIKRLTFSLEPYSVINYIWRYRLSNEN